MVKRQRFTKEFKVEALRLWKSSGRPMGTVETCPPSTPP